MSYPASAFPRAPGWMLAGFQRSTARIACCSRGPEFCCYHS
jgi:hypothetical protein